MPNRDGVRPGPGSQTKRLVVRLNEAQMTALQRHARERSLDVSAVVRQMLDDLLFDEE